MNTLDIKNKFLNSNTLILSDVYDKNLRTWGFIVNKNGKNIEEGIQFLNELLSDEVQIKFFEAKMDYAPVSESIEEKIRNIEIKKDVPDDAVKLREYILDEIKNGNYSTSINENIDFEKKKFIHYKFNKVLFKIVFADEPLTDDEINQMLQKLEDELNIYIQE